MLTTASAGVGGILPPSFAQLVIRPVQAASVAFQIATEDTTTSNVFYIPIVATDPVAAWVAEGQEINPTDAVLDQIPVRPSKVAGLSVITRELANDSNPAAANIVGQGLARDIARRVDEAFFGKLAEPAPSGLDSLTAVTTVAAGATWANLDPFAEAISKAEQVGAILTGFAANPTDALALSKLKEHTTSNRPLLGVDPAAPTVRRLQGVPLLVSPAVTQGTVWGIPRDRVHLVRREAVELAVDHSAYFTSDRVALRATMRVGFGFPHQTAIIRIKIGT
ncbi:phage major capsid protein [Actinokineospora iranica]|uniref:Phage major capsid protein, HK97 family n=1 Tax=Actinokineospora iranica TaxID=1271860 RepID=A0A1G6SNH8_9PSEU|nr:phage major capsid protein [Actinokineospora iranica]SDD18409.1 phage major capsid protein, HK97 family [Actinokineospora iranica]